MSMDRDVEIDQLRSQLADVVQEHFVFEGQVAIGAILLIEAIDQTGARILGKVTCAGGSGEPLPGWTQDGLLMKAQDHDYWEEWYEVGPEGDDD